MVLHAAGRNDDALKALYETRRLRALQFGERHPLVGDTDRMIGEVLADAGRQASALARFEQALELTTAGYGPDHPRTRRAALSLARAQARNGDPKALARIEAIAALAEDDPETGKLRWRARAYAAETRCHGGQQVPARAELAALQAELRAALPDGGVIPREVDAILVACDVLAKR